MLELLDEVWGLVVSLLELGRDAVVVVGGGVLDLLLVLHTDAPRLEGLLVGVVLAWVLLRRDKHPLLRVLSAPLKLVVDILDLAWDQVTEVAGDLWETGLGWLKKGAGLVLGAVKGVWDRGLGLLRGVRDRLLRRSSD